MNRSVFDRVKRATLAMQRYSWEQGVVAQAFLESGDAETAILMAVEGANRQIDDGRCAQIGEPAAATDPCAIGEALIFACEQTGDENLIQARDRLLKWALETAPRSDSGIVYHLVHAPQFWVDSLYMLPPFLARAGQYDEALHQIDGYWSALLDADKGLLSHQWDDGAKRFIRRDVWGVGNGWAAAGMARVIAMLPEGRAADRERLVERIRMILDAAIRLQRPDGLFHDVLDDPQTFAEVNSGQMFAYTIYRGVKAGWLNEGYVEAAERMRRAAQREVDRYGLVRNVCGMPSFDRPGVAPEGQAFYILMEAARADYAGHGND